MDSYQLGLNLCKINYGMIEDSLITPFIILFLEAVIDFIGWRLVNYSTKVFQSNAGLFLILESWWLPFPLAKNVQSVLDQKLMSVTNAGTQERPRLSTPSSNS